MAAIYRLLPGRCGRVRVGDHGRGIGDLALAQLHGTMFFYPSGILFLLLSLWDELEVYGVLLLGIFAGYLRYNNLPGCTIPITVQKKKNHPDQRSISRGVVGQCALTDTDQDHAPRPRPCKKTHHITPI
jgi:hypothetical protein